MATEPRRRSERIRAQALDGAGEEDEATLSQVRDALQSNATFFLNEDDSVRQPTDVPEFTIGTLRRAIPKHCFERRFVMIDCLSLTTAVSLAPRVCSLALGARPPSLLHSFAYLTVDLLLIASLFLFSTRIDSLAPAVARAVPVLPVGAVKAVMWAAYWFFQGAVATGVWVIAHECGHQAFSKHQAVNDGVGLVLHSLLLVPFYSWKFSHARHHANTGSVAKDEVFVPAVREKKDGAGRPFELFGPLRLIKLIGALTLGWPAYLMFNVKSRPYDESWVSHFDPWAPIFSKRQRLEIVVSDVALAVVMCGLYVAGEAMGWVWMAKTYVVPYLIVNFWLVMITLLQHTHPNLPHYTDAEWDWMRGALATVDRNYGWLLNTLHHHIADTHVVHHLFSTMPHYHAQEATEAIKPILGSYYMADDRFIFRALWADYSQCRYVTEEVKGSGILWF